MQRLQIIMCIHVIKQIHIMNINKKIIIVLKTTLNEEILNLHIYGQEKKKM